MADYVRRPKGTKVWHFDFQVGKQRARHSTGETSKSKAKEMALKLRAEMKAIQEVQEKALEEGSVTFSDAVELYDEGHGIDPNEEARVDWLVERIGDMPVALIGNKVVADLVIEKKRELCPGNKIKFVSLTTVNRSVPELLRKILYWVRDSKEIPLPMPPKWGAHRAKETPREREMTFAEQRRIEDKCDPELCDLVNFGTLTGLRKGNLILRWDQVDFAMGLIRMTTKGDQNNEIPITREIRKILMRQKGKKMNEMFVFCYQSQKTWVEPRTGQLREEGKFYPFTYNGLASMWQAVCKRAGVVDLHLHDLRRTFACRVTRVSGIAAASKGLCHKDPALTMRVYARLDTADARRGMEATEAQSEIWRQREMEEA